MPLWVSIVGSCDCAFVCACASGKISVSVIFFAFVYACIHVSLCAYVSDHFLHCVGVSISVCFSFSVLLCAYLPDCIHLCVRVCLFLFVSFSVEVSV